MSFIFHKEQLDSNTIQFSLSIDSKAGSFNDVIELLISSSSFRTELTNQFINIPFEGFFWEVKPVNEFTHKERFEFVVVNGQQLSSYAANSKRFEQYFIPHQSVVSFYNLGNDAKLVVPTKVNKETNYAHLASFLRSGLKNQIDEFWIMVGINYQKLITPETLWLSTAGLGVHWLHVRFDKRPKYYRYSPYKQTS